MVWSFPVWAMVAQGVGLAKAVIEEAKIVRMSEK